MLWRECMRPIASVVERMDDGSYYDAIRRIGISEYWAKSREDMVGAACAGADACCDCDERVAAGTAYAAEESAIGTDMSLGTADGGADSVPNGRPIVAEVRGRMKAVWSATLTVGEASQDETTILGYIPGRNVDIGDLDDTEFSDRGVEYAIDSLVHKEVGSINQLVLETSTGLPDDLIFEVDGERYAISDADALGLHKDIHVWWFDSGLGWSDGETMTVKLMRPRPYNPCRDE